MRKTTLGRRVRQIQANETIGFTVMVRCGTYGYKNKGHLKEFIEVNNVQPPLEKPSFKPTSNWLKRTKLYRALLNVEAAQKIAFAKGIEIFGHGNFNVLPKTIKSSKVKITYS